MTEAWNSTGEDPEGGTIRGGRAKRHARRTELHQNPESPKPSHLLVPTLSRSLYRLASAPPLPRARVEQGSSGINSGCSDNCRGAGALRRSGPKRGLCTWRKCTQCVQSRRSKSLFCDPGHIVFAITAARVADIYHCLSSSVSPSFAAWHIPIATIKLITNSMCVSSVFSIIVFPSLLLQTLACNGAC